MTKTEFIQIGLDLFFELKPSSKKSEVREYLTTMTSELEDWGLEFDPESEEDEEEL